MKKLLAVLVVFALVAGAAFAQVNVGGQVQAGAILIGGSSEKDSDIVAGARAPNPTTGLINARAGDDNVGAFVRVHSRTDGTYYSPTAFAFAWWKPIDQLRLQFGSNPDADWGAAQITGWGFIAEAQEFVAVDQWSGEGSTLNGSGLTNLEALVRTGFYGGFKNGGNSHALGISLKPIDNLGINIGFPFGDGLAKAAAVYSRTHVNVNYRIEDIGRLNISFVGNGVSGPDDDSNGCDLFLSFYLMAVENLGVDIGFDYTVPPKDADNLPVKIGLGVRYGAGDFGVKLRFAAAVGGEDKNALIGVNLLPYYNLGALTAFFNLGLGIFKFDGVDDAVVPWYVNPYIAVPAGGLKFFAGFKLSSDGVENSDGDKVVKWYIPIGVNIYF